METDHKACDPQVQVKNLLYRLRPGDVVWYEAESSSREGPVTVQVTSIEQRERHYCIVGEGTQDGNYLLLPEDRSNGSYDAPEAFYCRSEVDGPISDADLHTHGTITQLKILAGKGAAAKFAE